MITTNDIHHIKYDVMQYCTILFIASFINYQFKGTELFNEEWNNVALAALVGVLCSDIFITKFVKYINKKYKIRNKVLRNIIRDFFRYSTIFIFTQVTKNFITLNKICYTIHNFKLFCFTFFGFFIFNIVYSFIPKINSEYRLIIEDIIKLSFSIASVGIFLDNEIEYKHFIEFIIIIIGVITFHRVIKETMSVETITTVESNYPNEITLPPELLE
jgi:hypothetical protein